VLSELFPLFNAASPSVLEWLESVSNIEDHRGDEIIISEDNWGKDVYFIVSGWVKIRYLIGDKELSLEILSTGESFGALAVLEESLRYTEAVSISDVQLVSLSAQRFLQLLYKDSQIQQRMLQLTIRRIRQLYRRLQWQHQPSKVRVVKTLLSLSDNYGKILDEGTAIYNLPPQDLADMASLDLEETKTILEKLIAKGWIEIHPSESVLCITNPKQLHHFAKQLGQD
jgi:CRP/FNR family cyclic AMP-dependent transcriptional regulator